MAESIGPYRLLTELTTAGGGTCQWAMAEAASGERVFIKKFLTPTYPKPDGPGSEESKAKKRDRCEKFEQHQQALTKRIREVASFGGTLAVQIDFFRSGAHYYKVTEWIENVGSDFDLSSKRMPDRLLVAVTAAKSIQTLHAAKIVHGDLKPPNILIRPTDRSDSYSSRLIDFDSSYFSGEPPQPADMIGDFVYYSPEVLSYVKGDDLVKPSELTTASDVFAAGLIFHQYLVGSLPAFDRERFGTAAEAVVAEGSVEVASEGIGRGVQSLLSSMLSKEAGDRPSMLQVHQHIKELRRGPRGATSESDAGSPIATPEPGAIKIRMRKDAEGTGEGPDAVVRDEEPVSPEPEPTPRVKIRMRRPEPKPPAPRTKLKGKGLDIGEDS